MLLKISITDRDIVSAEALTNLIGALRTIADGAQGTLQNCAEAMETGALQSETITVETQASDKRRSKAKPAPAAKVEKKEPEPEPEVEDTSEAPAEEAENKPETDYKKVREEVRMELAAIARKGKTAEVKKLLEEHGAQKLSDIPDESLGDVLAAAKAL